MVTDRVELLAIERALLEAQNKILAVRISELERTFEARVHALELGLARLSHGPAEPTAVRPRRDVDDRGHVIMLRESAA